MYEKCQLPPDWNAYDQACEDQQMSIEPAQFFGCNPYGNAAAIEEMQAAHAAPPTTTEGELRAADGARNATGSGLRRIQLMEGEEESCRTEDEKADDFWRKEAVNTVLKPPSPKSLLLKVLKWVSHSNVGC